MTNSQAALQIWLSSLAELVDRQENLYTELMRRGFLALLPEYSVYLQLSDRDRIIRSELAKEMVGRRKILIQGKPAFVGYRSSWLSDACRAVGVDRDGVTSPITHLEYLPLISPAEARSRSNPEEYEKQRAEIYARSAAALDLEAVGALARFELTGLGRRQRCESMLSQRLSQLGFSVVPADTSYGDSELSCAVGRNAKLRIAVPRSGPSIRDSRPATLPMVVGVSLMRPEMQADDQIDLSTESLWTVDISWLVPGFSAYKSTLSWDRVARGVEAFAALFELVHRELASACLNAASALKT